MSNSNGDVFLFQTTDGGNINVVNGVVEMSGGLETSTYLSLFGGNEDDDGRDDNIFNWWGNLDEIDPAKRYRSETQHLLQSLPATTGNLRKLEEAGKRDLQWMLDEGVASSVEVLVTIPALNAVKITIGIEALGESFEFEFIENWKVLK